MGLAGLTCDVLLDRPVTFPQALVAPVIELAQKGAHSSVAEPEASQPDGEDAHEASCVHDNHPGRGAIRSEQQNGMIFRPCRLGRWACNEASRLLGGCCKTMST